MKGFTMTYNSDTKHGRIKTDSGFTYGGYSGNITVHRRFVVKVRIKKVMTVVKKDINIMQILEADSV
jgi:hypothetical protein